MGLLDIFSRTRQVVVLRKVDALANLSNLESGLFDYFSLMLDRVGTGRMDADTLVIRFLTVTSQYINALEENGDSEHVPAISQAIFGRLKDLFAGMLEDPAGAGLLVDKVKATLEKAKQKG